jgi:hypothetical protein
VPLPVAVPLAVYVTPVLVLVQVRGSKRVYVFAAYFTDTETGTQLEAARTSVQGRGAATGGSYYRSKNGT